MNGSPLISRNWMALRAARRAVFGELQLATSDRLQTPSWTLCRFWFVRVPACKTLLQVRDKPKTCRPKLRASLTNDMHRYGSPHALADIQSLQPPGANVLADYVPRHMAPTKAAEKILKPRGKVREAPDARAVDPSLEILREWGTVRHNELDLLLQGFSRQRAWLLCKRVINSHHRHHVDVRQKLRLQIIGASRQNGIDGEARLAITQSLLGCAQALGQKRDGQPRKSRLQRAQALHQQISGEQRINRDCQLGLAAASDGFGMHTQGVRALHHLTCVVEHHPTGVGQNRRFGGAIE